MGHVGTFTEYRALKKLPSLVRRQRTLAGRIAKAYTPVLVQDEKDEKELRAAIDLLLVAAGLKKSDVVTCNGYDVRHNERDGLTTVHADGVINAAVAGGVDRDFITGVMSANTETADPAKFATVTPSKGSKVRK